jgi:hypothetical protein
MLGGGDKPKRADYLRPLASWKEIASYLGVTPRTAQEWEKERGLPVHRRGNPQRPSVVAYPAELDQWRKGLRLEGDDPVTSARKPKAKTWRRRVLLLSSLALVFLGWWVILPAPSSPAFCHVEGELLKVFDVRGSLLWTFSVPGYQHHINSPHQVIDLDGDGRPEVLFNVIVKESEDQNRLVCFDSAGRIRWEYFYGAVKTWGDRTFDNNYYGRLVQFIRSASGNYILVSALHGYWFPCRVSLLDAVTGEQVSEYWHPGSLVSCLLYDLDGDGDPEILLGGINNPGVGCLGRAVLVALKIPFSPPLEDAEERMRNFGGGEFRYCVFPSADVFQVRNRNMGVMEIIEAPGEGLRVAVSNHQDGHLWYQLDKDFRPSDVVPDLNYITAHRDFAQKGLLDHQLTLLKETFLYESAPGCPEH